MSVRTAVVLAAGEGMRLRPLTQNRPKPMLPAANRPILQYVLDALIDAGIERIAIVVGYKRDRVQNYFGPTYRDVPLAYVGQDKQLGSGHALLQAREAVDEPMIVVNGDHVIEAAIVSDVMDAFDSETGDPTLAILEDPNPERYGAVVVSDGELAEIIEKPESDAYHFINGGVYAFSPSIFDAIADTPRQAGELALTETIARILDDRPVRTVETRGLWVDATYPWDLLTLSREILARGITEEPEREDSIWIAESARVHDDAVFQPPVVIGPNSEISAGAVVGPNVALGRNVTIGPNVTITSSLLDTDTRVGAGSTLVDTVTGQGVTFGPATVVTGGPGDVRVGNTIHEDEDLGALVADRVTVEGGVGFAPGTLVGPSATLRTGVRVSGCVAEDAEVVR